MGFTGEENMMTETRMSEDLHLVELDENLDICGKRTVGSSDKIITVVDPPKSVAMFRVDLGTSFTFVETMEILWLAHEECIEYELANKSRYILKLDVSVPDTSEEEYDAAWKLFRERGADGLTATLGLSSWGIGGGFRHRRGQDLFVSELDGMECPLWEIYLTIDRATTYGNCVKSAVLVDRFFSEVFVPCLRPASA